MNLLALDHLGSGIANLVEDGGVGSVHGDGEVTLVDVATKVKLVYMYRWCSGVFEELTC